MPLHVARLRDSDLASEEEPEACWYAVLLWAASWHQIPAASLPDNDAVLTKLIGLGRDVKTFRKHKAGALRGFVLCDDGRLYHPVVAEQARTAWNSKLEQRWRTECARIKKANQRNGTDHPCPTFEDFVSQGTSADFAASVLEDTAECPEGQTLQQTGKGTGRPSSDPDGSARPAGHAPNEELDPLADLRALPIAKGCWRLAVQVLVEQGRISDAKARAFVGKLKAGGLTDDELWQIAEGAWREQTEDPQPYMVKASAKVIERRGEGGGLFSPAIRAPSPERQRAWMQDWRENPTAWRDHERGPPPGRPGCQIAPEIQREFDVEPASPQPIGRVA
jgi:hypothetical protein